MYLTKKSYRAVFKAIVIIIVAPYIVCRPLIKVAFKAISWGLFIVSLGWPLVITILNAGLSLLRIAGGAAIDSPLISQSLFLCIFAGFISVVVCVAWCVVLDVYFWIVGAERDSATGIARLLFLLLAYWTVGFLALAYLISFIVGLGSCS